MKKKVNKTKKVAKKKIASKVVSKEVAKVKVEKAITKTIKITRIEFVRRLVRKYFRGQGFWRKTQEEQAPILQAFWKEVQNCTSPAMTTALHFPSTEDTHDSSINAVHMTKASVMTLLHLLRAVLQTHLNSIRIDAQHEDCMYWSHIVFREAMPNLYVDSCNRKLFFHFPERETLDKAKKIYDESEFVTVSEDFLVEPSAKEGQVVLSTERRK